MMRVRATVTGSPPSMRWTAQTMRAVGEAVASQIVQRTFVARRGLTGARHAPYSTTRLVVVHGRGLGARLRPKGGRPYVVHHRSGATSQARLYVGGYAEYKQASQQHRSDAAPGITRTQRQTAASSAASQRSSDTTPDLILSGELMRSVVVLSHTTRRAVVGIRGPAAAYAAGTHAQRPWWGLSRADTVALERHAFPAIAEAAVRGGR